MKEISEKLKALWKTVKAMFLLLWVLLRLYLAPVGKAAGRWVRANFSVAPAQVGRIALNGLLFRNPTFVLLLGLCPALAVTTSLQNGLGMGLTTAVVLACSNLVISLLRWVIPVSVRIVSYLVIIAAFVTAADLLLRDFFPSLSQSLGLYVPLIAVNCLLLARAEVFASRHLPGSAFLDGAFMGLGFTAALAVLGAVREALGAGTIWGAGIPVLSDYPVGLILAPCGGFITLGFLAALVQWLRLKSRKGGEEV